jgi:hypothetical protein
MDTGAHTAVLKGGLMRGQAKIFETPSFLHTSIFVCNHSTLVLQYEQQRLVFCADLILLRTAAVLYWSTTYLRPFRLSAFLDVRP